MIRFGLWHILILSTLISCGSQEQEIAPVRKTVVEAVYAGGTIHPQNEYKAFANATGILSKLYVEEGDTISANSPLFGIDSKDPDLREQNAREQLRFAESNAAANSPLLAELRANIESAQARFSNDSTAFARTSALFSQHAATKSEYDRTASQFETSKAALSAARSKYASSRAALSNQLVGARSQRQIAAALQDNFVVRSIVGGRVYAIYKEPGEIVNSQQPVAVVGDASRFVLRLVVDQTDIVRIALGQEVLYTIDALPDSIFRARVSKIYPTLDNETQSYRIDAECAVTPPVPYLGTQVQANIVVRRKENALVIPRGYLQAGGIVYVRDSSGEAKATTVKVGIVNLEYVEILHGIDESSRILPKP